jgi:hypothetical protein
MLSKLLLISGMLVLPLAAAGGVDDAWKNLLALNGEWQGDGRKAVVTYTIVSGGSVVMERMQVPSEPDMVTMYHRDGTGLVATHYCSMGNQPRMRAPEADAKTIRFRFADITNLKPGDGHIKDLTVAFRTRITSRRSGPASKTARSRQ